MPTHHPLALRVLLEALPVLVQQPTGSALYHEFIRRWLNEEALRIKQMQRRRNIDVQLDVQEIRRSFYSYSQNLALAMFKQGVDVVLSHSAAEDHAREPHPIWGRFFTPQLRTQQEGSPIMRTGKCEYRFVGKALQQYLVSQRIIEEILQGRREQQGDDHEDEQKEDRKIDADDEADALAVELLDQFTPQYLLNQGLFTGKATLVRFLADEIKRDPARQSEQTQNEAERQEDIRRRSLQAYFQKLVVKYKRDAMFKHAVCNSLTVLVAAGISLRGINLSGVCICVQLSRNRGINGDVNASWSGADLTGADLRNSQLSNADMRGCILRNARLDNAVVTGVKWDQACLQGASFEGLQVDKHISYNDVQDGKEAAQLGALVKRVMQSEIDSVRTQYDNLYNAIKAYKFFKRTLATRSAQAELDSEFSSFGL